MSDPVANAASAAGQPGEYLTFKLGEEEYALDILRVQEIRSYVEPTRIPRAPAFLKGVVNLRGVIVPIIDLRVRLGCVADFNAFTVVIVLNIKGRIIGAVVDSVSDVVELRQEQIKPVGKYHSSDNGNFVVSTATVGERTLLVMDINGLMSSPELELFPPEG